MLLFNFCGVRFFLNMSSGNLLAELLYFLTEAPDPCLPTVAINEIIHCLVSKFEFTLGDLIQATVVEGLFQQIPLEDFLFLVEGVAAYFNLLKSVE